MASHFLSLGVLVVLCSVASATDPDPLQDFCVADLNSKVRMNGYACKDPDLVEVNDFYYSGFRSKSNTSNAYGSKVNRLTAKKLPGMNTQGLSVVRIDVAPRGLNPPHSHPRAAEILTVIEGTMEVSFVSSNPENRMFSKVLKKGDVFVIPKGLVHFERNVGDGHAMAISAFNSQFPGVNTITNVLMGSKPSIPSDVLAKAFQVDVSMILQMQSNITEVS